MPAGSLIAFWGVALLLIAVPGADWAFTLSAGLRGRSVLPAVGGLVLGYAAMTVVVAAGAGALIAANPRALTGLTIAGGGYLMWHGAWTVHRPPAPPAPPVAPVGTAGACAASTRTATAWATLARGAGVSGLNPKGLLIFLALLPRFTGPGRTWPPAVQLSALGLVFVLTCAAFYHTLGSLARTVLHARPAAARTVSRLAGAGMLAVGAVLIADRLI
jgi:threonine/homoserine/homoserine lactone efflux protein